MTAIIGNYGSKKKWNWNSAILLAGLTTLGWPAGLQATTYEVGLGQAYPTIASVPRQGPGDIVNIHCGTYNEVRRWLGSGTAASPITLRGVCSTGRPVIDGMAHTLTGDGSVPRAVWQIEGSFYIIENLEFKNGRNGDNGAGIRAMNTSITIRNCKITQCDMGIMSSTSNATQFLVENTEIAFNGTNNLDGQSHNVYLTGGDNITFQFCYIHDSVSGENFKTRAHYTQLFYNYIADGAESEVEGLDGNTKTPNSNMTMIGNVLVSTPNRTVNTTKFINFGQDVGGLHNGTLYLINNTLIAGSPTIGFLRSSATDSSIVAENNIFFGSHTIVQPGWGNRISGKNNWLPNTATIPLGFAATTTGADPGFMNAVQENYHLTATAQARGIGFALPIYVDGAGIAHSAAPAFEYVQNLASVARPIVASLDAGAYEYGAAAASVIRVRAGSASSYTDPQGNPWSGDQGYSGGNTYSTSAPIANTTTPALYQNERWQNGGFTYTFAVPNGVHTVTLKFSENYFTQPGQRVFGVSINGQTVLSNFDIVAAAGGAHKAIDKSFPVSVAGGAVTIHFLPGAANNPKINALEIQ